MSEERKMQAILLERKLGVNDGYADIQSMGEEYHYEEESVVSMKKRQDVLQAGHVLDYNIVTKLG